VRSKKEKFTETQGKTIEDSNGLLGGKKRKRGRTTNRWTATNNFSGVIDDPS